MAIQQILKPEGPAAPNEARAEQPELLIDQFLPRYDLAIVHAEGCCVPRPTRATARRAALTCL